MIIHSIIPGAPFVSDGAPRGGALFPCMPRKIKTLERNDKTPRFLALIIPCLNASQKNVTLHSNFLICQAMQKSAKKRAGTQR